MCICIIVSHSVGASRSKTGNIFDKLLTCWNNRKLSQFSWNCIAMQLTKYEPNNIVMQMVPCIYLHFTFYSIFSNCMFSQCRFYNVVYNYQFNLNVSLK